MAAKKPAKKPAKGRSKLSEYERKRDFSKTGEPSGKGKRSKAKRRHPRFAIQKHAATSLHYDLRLEIGGTLASWAVPKGPSLDPRDKRLAMRTEDHPLEYLSWEGVIPKGEYGGGEMIVWDRGVFENISKTRSGRELSLEEALEKGDLKLFLLGEKIKRPLRPGPHERPRRPRAMAADQEEGRGRRRPPAPDVEPARVGAQRSHDRATPQAGRLSVYRMRMRSSRILLSALAATTALVLAFASTASAGTLDQQQTSSNSNVGLFSTQTPAQTFTAGISGGLDQVDLLLFKVGTPPASVTVEIRNTSAGQPGTGVLATASLPTSAIGTTEAFVPVTFATPVPVTAGTQYAVLAYTPGTASNTVGWRFRTAGNPYSPGAEFISNDPLPPGGNWQSTGVRRLPI